MGMHRGDLARDLSQRLNQVRRASCGRSTSATACCTATTRRPKHWLGNQLAGGQQVFRLAAELAYLEFGGLIDTLVDEGKFTSAESRTLARLVWPTTSPPQRCCPYKQFHTFVAENSATTSNVSAHYSMSYETIRHRLSTLQRPSMRGVPLSFVRVDRAGNMSKRQSATGFHFSSSGGTCPLWNVYETFANPGKISVQIAQMPDGAPICGWHAPSSAARIGMVSRVRPLPSDWDANCAMPTGSSASEDWI